MGFLKTARLDPAARMRAVMADVSDQVRDDASQIRDATIAAVENLQKHRHRNSSITRS